MYAVKKKFFFRDSCPKILLLEQEFIIKEYNIMNATSFFAQVKIRKYQRFTNLWFGYTLL